MTEDLISEFINKNNVIAVVGVSDNVSKYGNIIFHDLLKAGYKVYALHPAGGEISGHTRYTSLAELPEKPDVVNIVVPPDIAKKVIEEALGIGIDKVWLQPGSESDKAIKFCKEYEIKCLSGVCIMVEKLKA